MNPRQNFYSSVFDQIMNYKKEREFNSDHNFLFDPIVGLGLFATVLVVGVFSGYLPSLPQLGVKQSSSTAFIKSEERAAADVFSPDNSNAAENPNGVNVSSLVVVSSEDSYVGADAPQKSYGSEGSLKINKSPQRIAFLKFKVPADTKYSKVLLRVNPKDSNDNGGVLSVLSDNLWSERLLTFDSKPVQGEFVVGLIGPVSARVAKTIDVTSYIQPGKTYTFKIATEGAESVDYYSRESSSESSPALVFVN